jgi:hypothetical protein
MSRIKDKISAGLQPNLSRYAVCRVGEGFSVENRRTHEREGWFWSQEAAQKAAANLSAALRAALTAGEP